MKVRVLGCHGGVAPEYQTSCYLVNESFLIDAGSVCSALTPEHQAKITDIFITHPHLDHIKDICFVMENSFSPEREILHLRSTPEILDDVHNHMLNDIIWPDFSKIPVGPNKDKFLLKFDPIKDSIDIRGVNVKPFKANHPGNAVGYLLDDGEQQVIFTGDSGPNAAIWKLANSCDRLKAIFTEITFPSRMDVLANVSGHFTLQQLIEDLTLLENKEIPIYISHFKPLFLSELMDEFHRDAPDQLILMHEEDEIPIV